MGKVVIELIESVELRIKAKTLTDAIEKLMASNTNTATTPTGLERFKGIVRSNKNIDEEEWYKQ